MKNEEENVFEGWETPGTNFFDDPEKEVVEEVEEKVEDSNEDSKVKTPKSKVETKEEEEEEDEDDPFEDFKGDNVEDEEDDDEDEIEEEEEEEEEDEKKKPKVEKKKKGKKALETSDPDSSITTVEYLKKKGIIEYELEDEAALDSATANEILEDSIEDMLEERMSSKMKALPDVVKELVKFTSKGGSAIEFIDGLKNSSAVGVTKDLDLDDEDNQELIISTFLRENDYTDAEVEDQIEYLKEKDKLGDKAKSYHQKLMKKQDKELQAYNIKQQEVIEKSKERQRTYRKNIVSNLGNDSIDGWAVTKREKRDLPEYMAEATVNLKDGQRITPMQRDLYEALSDPKKQIIMAKLLKNGFDISEITKRAKTKVTKDIKNNVRRVKTKKKKSGGNELADYF